jgi:hypothetical protein
MSNRVILTKKRCLAVIPGKYFSCTGSLPAYGWRPSRDHYVLTMKTSICESWLSTYILGSTRHFSILMSCPRQIPSEPDRNCHWVSIRHTSLQPFQFACATFPTHPDAVNCSWCFVHVVSGFRIWKQCMDSGPAFNWKDTKRGPFLAS